MAVWCAPVIGVTLVTLTILLVLSYDTLEYQEIGLNFSWISETIATEPYSSGRYYLGLGNHFIKFPQMVKSVFFTDDRSTHTHGPALTSRTKDGLNIKLEVSFQYRLKIDKLYDMYMILGPTYELTFVRMAIEQLTTASTQYNAFNFFSNRTLIGDEMHRMLDSHFQGHHFAEVPFFQLRTVTLPEDFETSIQDTQVKQQEIQIALAERSQNEVAYQTRVLQAEQAVKVMQNQALAEAAAIMAQNDAYCRQYRITQSLQSESLKSVQASTGWNATQLLEYLRIRALRDHPSDRTTIRM